MSQDTRPETLEAWVLENLAESLEDIAQYGCQGGFSGITYYTETCALYDHYHQDIWNLLNDLYEDLGYPNVLSLIASFGGADNVRDRDTFENLLVWAAIEEIARKLTAERRA